MAGIAASNESPGRRAGRLAAGVLPGFVLAQLIAWPLAFLAPVFATVLLMDAAPPGIRAGLKLFRNCAFFVILGAVVTWALTPWPAILAPVSVIMIFGMFLFMLTAGAHLLEIVATLIGFTVLPVVVVLLPELGFLALYYLLLNFGAALLTTWIAWLLVPLAQTPPEDHHAEPMAFRDAAPVAGTLAVVVGGLMAAFLLFGWSKILVLVYGVIFGSAYSSAGGHEAGVKSIIANAVYGGLAMLVCYELIVMAPTVPFMAVLVCLAVFLFGTRLFGDGPTAAYWNSGLFGFLIMLGGQLLSESASTATLFGRVWQLVLATAYVTFAFSVVEWIWSWGDSKQSTQEGETDGPVETG